MVDQYFFGGGLPEENTTYVTRRADDQLYFGLKAGKFCYVLNSSQTGKSSLRIRTMRRLREDGVECTAIDLSGGSIDSVSSQEQWYKSLVDTLSDFFLLEVNHEWWEQNQSYSVVTRLRKFLEQILLAQIKQDIVIFIDEIGTVLSLKFPTDDFFSFIRFCYQQRVDNSEYKRLTFCLLGIASPGSLIQNINSTPFNIGTPIYLQPFQIGEVEPLKKGLQKRYSDPKVEVIIRDIFYWTGGQPFLTQKLCYFMVEEFESENPRTVEQVVRDQIIENWEYQDEPQHLRTIRNRILNNEQLAPYLLELYRRVLEGGIIVDNTPEQYELQLSGLVVKKQNKLIVHNRIYQEIFDINWIQTQLNNLRPYSENFRAWVASGKTDKSRLLKGKALQEALAWASNKNISYEDRDYLSISQLKESQDKMVEAEQFAALERERKTNQALHEANKKAKKIIIFGCAIFAVTLLGAVFTWLLTKKQVDETKEVINIVQQLNTQAGELQTQDRPIYYEALRLAALTYNIDNRKLKLALAFAATSQVKQQQDKIEEAKQEIKTSYNYLSEVDKNVLDSPQGVQTQILFEKYKGSLLAQEKATQKEAIESYKAAFNMWKEHPKETDFTKPNQLLSTENVESVHLELIEVLSKNNIEKDLTKQVEKSLTEYMYTQLKYYLTTEKWFAADDTTYRLLLYIAKSKYSFLDSDSINNLYCPDLQRIDKLWLKSSLGKFGFSVQKNIFLETGNKLDRYDEKVYQRFGLRVGWYNQERDQKTNGNGWLNRGQLNYTDKAPKGHLPGNGAGWLWSGTQGLHEGWRFSSRTAACTLSTPKLTKHD